MDKKISYTLYSFSKKNNSINLINIYIENWSSRLFFFVYISALLFLAFSKHDKLIYFILSPLILVITNNLLRKIFKRARPQYIYNKENIKKSYSFPSNHSACSCVIATACFFVNPILGISMFICSIIVGFNRVMSGFHYISDVLVGWIIGIIIGLLGFMYF